MRTHINPRNKQQRKGDAEQTKRRLCGALMEWLFERMEEKTLANVDLYEARRVAALEARKVEGI